MVMSAQKICTDTLRRDLRSSLYWTRFTHKTGSRLPCLTERGLKQRIRCLQSCSKAWKSKLQAELPGMIQKTLQNHPHRRPHNHAWQWKWQKCSLCLISSFESPVGVFPWQRAGLSRTGMYGILVHVVLSPAVCHSWRMPATQGFKWSFYFTSLCP